MKLEHSHAVCSDLLVICCCLKFGVDRQVLGISICDLEKVDSGDPLGNWLQTEKFW